MARPKTVGTPLVTSEETIDCGNVAANTCLDVTHTVEGLRLNHPVVVWATGLTANLGIGNAHCSAKDTLKFRLVNPTGSGIDPASMSFMVVQF